MTDMCDIIMFNYYFNQFFFSLFSFFSSCFYRSDNPINCSCDTQELWEWLRDHQKWFIDEKTNIHNNKKFSKNNSIDKNANNNNSGNSMKNKTNNFYNLLKCEQPQKLRGKILIEMEPQEFCDAPIIIKLAIQDIQPYSVLVSWQSRKYSGLHGYQIVYNSMDSVDEVMYRMFTIDV
jgi:hypothetical protein